MASCSSAGGCTVVHLFGMAGTCQRAPEGAAGCGWEERHLRRSAWRCHLQCHAVKTSFLVRISRTIGVCELISVPRSHKKKKEKKSTFYAVKKIYNNEFWFFFLSVLVPSGGIAQRVAGSCQGFLSKIPNQEITCPPQQGYQSQDGLVVDRGDGGGVPLPASAN